MRRLATAPAALLLLVLAASCPALAQELINEERINDFVSHVVVHPDASLTVTETITVTSTGQEIKRGIIREFPTTYEDRYGNTVRVGFEVLGVKRDGLREPYHLEPVGNGQKVYIGQKEVFLQPGRHTFTITYRTDRQLGFFEGFDELYWNVTGNGWSFAIERAEASIELPRGASLLQQAAYTGPQGSQGEGYEVVQAGEGHIGFVTTRPLRPYEGLTVAVAWPKGFVKEPTREERLAWLLSDNAPLVAALIGLAFVLAYYLFVWFLVGRDPARGTIIPLFEPPQGLSPAACRFVSQMGFDQKAFAASVVNMAVKGYLKIEEEGGTFKLRQVKGADKGGLAPGEWKLAGELFKSQELIVLKDTNHQLIGGAIKALEGSLKGEYEQGYFHTNRGYFVPGLVLSALALFSVAGAAEGSFVAVFAVLWLSGWTAGCAMIGWQVLRAWQQAASRRGWMRIGAILPALFMTAFALPFFGAELFGLWFLTGASLLPVGVVAATLFLNPIFYWLLKAPTLAGRRLLDQIEGFKLYLSVAERERLNMLNPPEKTPALFERYLPYALALDVEQEWGEQFADVIARSGKGGREYSPTWYTGTSWQRLGSSGLASNLSGSFSSAISSSSSPPGSSSGSGGGGSSGGGGGGGGGSGW